jgi:hypothetical protein
MGVLLAGIISQMQIQDSAPDKRVAWASTTKMCDDFTVEELEELRSAGGSCEESGGSGGGGWPTTRIYECPVGVSRDPITDKHQ